MLKEMDIFVRSHLSPLRPEQVALMRARWERDKRKQKEPAAPPKRRRAVKIVEPVAPVVEARPKRRRRTAAEVAAAEAEAQVEAALEAEREATKAREALEAASLALEEEQKTVSLEERRREKGKKRKKGKKSLVDQEAVAQNISRTLASIKGPVGKRGVHRREEGPSFRDLEEQKRREEKEGEKTLGRGTEVITVSELANTLQIPAQENIT